MNTLSAAELRVRLVKEFLKLCRNGLQELLKLTIPY